MADVFLEVALNGPWSRDRQPLMPISVEDLVAEGLACAALGAAVIHLHVYDPATGRQFEDFDAYARVIEGIRAQADVIVYPTLPLAGSADAIAPMRPEERFATVEALARAGLLEWAVIDPGSTILASHAELATGGNGFLYRNSVEELRHGFALAAEHRFHPSYAIYEPGFLRLGAEMAWRAGCPEPVYRLMFSDGFTFGFPPRVYALDAYCALLDEVAPGALWMSAGLQVDLSPVFDATLARGGHIRVGLEDAPFHCDTGNVALTEAAVARIVAAGHSPGSAAALRARLG
ncbi:3-keto-5-aminohexanoate cleavage protein [Maliponia aquimaris]|uniref:3-keto-5-aminohexanoate cleavage enzyme n=1 Tax=Maliponia aquimaris TaxID=1673631 RepID=A0A238K183_9RHOB|nr:3-keto-5-aminohexanoate cleavage protein [Maliponia aquimaris]SMX36681.1 3-keto-5-aminohexanoate cleavage enzyme [Maliponia aquimaris]